MERLGMASGPQCLVLDDAASILAVSSEAEVSSPSAGELGCAGEAKLSLMLGDVGHVHVRFLGHGLVH